MDRTLLLGAGFGLLATLAPLAPAEEASRTEESFIPNYAVAASYFSWNGDADFSGASGSLSQWESGIEANVPLWKNDQFRVTGGVRYRFNRLDFSGAPAPILSSEFDLHRIDIPFNVWVDLNDRWNAWVSLRPGFNSDFRSVDSNDFVLTALALASWEYNEKLTIAFGAYYSRDLGEETVLPAAGFIWKPDPRWSVGLTIPRVQVTHAPTRDWLLTLQAMPSGGGWNIDDPSPGNRDRDVDLNYRAIQGAFIVERRLQSAWWAYLSTGVQFSQEVELDGSAVKFDEDLDEAFSIEAGVKARF